VGAAVIVLAIESATEVGGVALADDVGVRASASVARGRRHVEAIVPAVDFVCSGGGVQLSDVDAVAVDVGPGLFSGLRVGVATAKALAYALGRPMVVLTSLEVLAHAVAASGVGAGRLVVPVVDARRGEVFASWFRTTEAGAVPLSDDARRTPDALAAELAEAGEPVVMAGDGALRYAPLFSAVGGAAIADLQLNAPPVEVGAALGSSRAAAGQFTAETEVAPRYLRDADTRINWERRSRPSGVSG
jgi:tRNA threonylcarbamoyladenosine biosynthesis protein TsaB